jgi:GNAT superfamily N-acetyltransferase
VLLWKDRFTSSLKEYLARLRIPVVGMEIVVATQENGGLDFIFTNATREGWSPGFQDLSVYSAVDPNGIFIGVVDTKIVGCISAVRFEDSDYGFIGYFIVQPEERRRGYGRLLF